MVLLFAVFLSKSQFYLFDPTELHEIVRHSLIVHGHLKTNNENRTIPVQHESPNSIRPVITTIVEKLREKIDGKYLTEGEEWIFNNAGGAMGAMFILHASLTEYLIVFGTPLGTEGHTGLHTADDYFHILFGEQWAFSAGNLDKEVYRVGDVHFLPKGQTKQFKMHRACWALEYARGSIVPMMPFGLADTIFSTLDYKTLFHTIRISAREMFRNLFNGKV